MGITVVILLKSHKTMHSRAEMRKQRHLAKESSCHVGTHSGMKSFIKTHTHAALFLQICFNDFLAMFTFQLDNSKN